MKSPENTSRAVSSPGSVQKEFIPFWLFTNPLFSSWTPDKKLTMPPPETRNGVHERLGTRNRRAGGRCRQSVRAVRGPVSWNRGATWKAGRIESSREDRRESTGRLWTWPWSFRSIAAGGARGAAGPRTVLSIAAIRSGRRPSGDTAREPTGTFGIRTGRSSFSELKLTVEPGSPGSGPEAGGGPADGWTWTRHPEPNRS